MNYDKNFFTETKKSDRILKVQALLNRIFNRFKMKVEVTALLDNSSDMVSDFQKVNFYHLLNRVLDEKIEGDVVELGCFEGQIAMLLQYILQQTNSDKKLIVFDNFKHDFGLNTDIKARLISNFNNRNLKIPEIIDGDFKNTLSANLPEKISFLHIDCGFGGDKIAHRDVIVHALENAYPRMSKGAIGMFMDYHDSDNSVQGINSNPGVKLATNLFFKDKPEKVYTLYGGQYSHGYFLKA